MPTTQTIIIPRDPLAVFATIRQLQTLALALLALALLED